MRRPLLCILPLLAGCYSYTLIPPDSAQPGTDVRARITPAAAKQLAPLLGAADMQSLAGRLVEIGPTSLTLEVPTVIPGPSGGSVQTISQRVAIARPDLIGIETRTRDNLRTGLLVGGVTLAVGTAAVLATRGQSTSGSPRPSGGQDMRIPFIQLLRLAR